MKKTLLFLFLLLCASSQAQLGNVSRIFSAGPPSGACPNTLTEDLDTTNNNLYGCSKSGTWFQIGGVTGSGTVSSVGSGSGLTGGPITTSGTLSIATGGVTNTMLANPSATVNGQSCSLGSSCTAPTNVTAGVNTNATFYPLFVPTNSSLNQSADIISSFNINPGTGVLNTLGPIIAGAQNTSAGGFTANGGLTPGTLALCNSGATGNCVTFTPNGNSSPITLNLPTGAGTIPSSATAPLGLSAAGAISITSAQGNGSKVQLSTGTTTTNDCVKFDGNGNTVDAGAACGSGGGGFPSGVGIAGNIVSGSPVTSATFLPPVDIRLFFTTPYPTYAQAQSQDFGAVLNAAWTAATPTGACVDVSGLNLLNAPNIAVYPATTNPYVGLASNTFVPCIVGGNFQVVIGATWATPGGSLKIAGNAPGGIGGTGMVLQPCNTIGGCTVGGTTVSQFPTSAGCASSGGLDCYATGVPSSGALTQCPTGSTCAGTVTYTTGSKTVTGSGTNWNSTLVGGTFVSACGAASLAACTVGSTSLYTTGRIVAVGSSTSLTLDATYAGNVASGTAGQSYVIFLPNTSVVFCAACLGNNLQKSTTGQEVDDFAIDLNGVSGVGYLAKGAQEGSVLNNFACFLSFGTPTGLTAGGTCLAWDQSVRESGATGGTAANQTFLGHFSVHDGRMGVGVSGAGGSNAFGAVIEGFSRMDGSVAASQANGPSDWNFQAIIGGSGSNRFQDAVYVDGISGMHVSGTHIESVLNDDWNIGPVNPVYNVGLYNLTSSGTLGYCTVEIGVGSSGNQVHGVSRPSGGCLLKDDNLTTPTIATSSSGTPASWTLTEYLQAGNSNVALTLGGNEIINGSLTTGDTVVNQTNNGDDALYMQRNTNTSPTGNFIHAQTAGNTPGDLFTVDVAGDVSAAGNLNITGNTTGVGSGAFSGGVTGGTAGTVSGSVYLPSGSASIPSAGGAGWTTTSPFGMGASLIEVKPPSIVSGLIGGTASGSTFTEAIAPAAFDSANNAILNSFVQVANDTSTGTTANLVARLLANGAVNSVVTAGTSTGNKYAVLGVCVTNCGTTGTATIQTQGLVNCTFDGTPAAVNNFVVPSATSGGKCSDFGSATVAPTNSIASLGRVWSTTAVTGSVYTILLEPPQVIGMANPMTTAGDIIVAGTVTGGVAIANRTPCTSGILIGGTPPACGTTPPALTLANSTVATTQSQQDNSTNVATTAYVDSHYVCAPQTASTAYTNASITTEQIMNSVSCEIPASALISGRVIRVVLGFDATTASTGGSWTLNGYLCQTSSACSGTKVAFYTSGAGTPTTTYTGASGGAEFDLVGTAAAGGSAAVNTTMINPFFSSALTSQVPFGHNSIVTQHTFATNVNEWIVFSVTYSSTTGTNSLTPTTMLVKWD